MPLYILNNLGHKLNLAFKIQRFVLSRIPATSRSGMGVYTVSTSQHQPWCVQLWPPDGQPRIYTENLTSNLDPLNVIQDPPRAGGSTEGPSAPDHVCENSQVFCAV